MLKYQLCSNAICRQTVEEVEVVAVGLLLLLLLFKLSRHLTFILFIYNYNIYYNVFLLPVKIQILKNY
jgi:hypothetical protein